MPLWLPEQLPIKGSSSVWIPACHGDQMGHRLSQGFPRTALRNMAEERCRRKGTMMISGHRKVGEPDHHKNGVRRYEQGLGHIDC